MEGQENSKVESLESQDTPASGSTPSGSDRYVTPLCNIQKIYPSKTELSTINNAVYCTEENCNELFTSNSNLSLHLYKTHNKKDAIQFSSDIKQFHCPEARCSYHENQHFKTKKSLKQHYLKVHSPKTYICETCNEGFSSVVYKNMHVDYCGVTFKCNECPMSYPQYESLMTHARRKNHEILEKTSFRLSKSDDKRAISVSKSDSNIRKLKPILAKPSSSDEYLIISTNLNSRNDRGIQTDKLIPKLKSKLTQINRNSLISRKDTRETQTGYRKNQLTAETQTIGDYFKRKKFDVDNEQKKYIKTQSSTQTTLIPSKSVSSNTVIDINDFEFSNVSEVKRSSSSTQTSQTSNDILYSSTTNTHDSIHTDTSDLMENFDTSFFNCNMETQTDLIFNDDLFDYCDYYSNMYTQTCEDMLLNSLELNNIETQTVDEMLKSVESQTTMSQNKKPQMSCRDISHMETQTDIEFKQMLEAINA